MVKGNFKFIDQFQASSLHGELQSWLCFHLQGMLGENPWHVDDFCEYCRTLQPFQQSSCQFLGELVQALEKPQPLLEQLGAPPSQLQGGVSVCQAHGWSDH